MRYGYISSLGVTIYQGLAGRSLQNFYDGGSVEIHPASNSDSTIREIEENGEVSEYVCVRYSL
jgi:hypothetical protein